MSFRYRCAKSLSDCIRLASEPFSRLTVLRVPIASRSAIQPNVTVVDCFTASTINALRSSPRARRSRSRMARVCAH